MQKITITLPDWLCLQNLTAKSYPEPGEQILLAIKLAEQNVKNKTGGPFGAAVFDSSGNLISVGVNRVESQKNSVAHAEIMAIMLAQSSLAKHRLDLEATKSYVLASSSQPCSMCFGALLWSGVHHLIFGATRDDVIQLAGFDEGPLPENWIKECQDRGITITESLLRDRACLALKEYTLNEGTVY